MKRSALAAIAALVWVGELAAQTGAERLAPTISASVGIMQYDLSGVGDSWMAAVRFDQPLATRYWLLEGGLVLARPGQQFGDTTTFAVAEAQLQLQWPTIRLSPYLGAGGGIALDLRDDADGGVQSDLTLSVSGGGRFQLRERLGMRAELRVRGIGTGFTGSTAEWTLGLSWRL